MDWHNRIIDIREAEKECMECPNRWLKNTTNACRNCIYDALLTKIETEKKAMANAEKNVCDICRSGWKPNCTNCIYSWKKKTN